MLQIVPGSTINYSKLNQQELDSLIKENELKIRVYKDIREDAQARIESLAKDNFVLGSYQNKQERKPSTPPTKNSEYDLVWLFVFAGILACVGIWYFQFYLKI